MNVKVALAWANNELKNTKISEPESSALVLLADVLNMSRTDLLAHPEKELSFIQTAKFRRYVTRRQKHESVWHIIGRVEFCGLEFKVAKDVLVPRPETELLVSEALKLISNNLKYNNPLTSNLSPLTLLDTGTGSGAIAVALASKLETNNTKHQIVATDISEKALAVARWNAKNLKVEKSIKFLRADLFPPTSDLSPLTFEIITANLPYIPTENMASLPVEVGKFDPKLALDGGPGGLVIYDKFLSQVGRHIAPGGCILCEIGINQGKPFKKLVAKYLPEAKVRFLPDLAGIDRVAIIKTDNT